MVCGQAEAALTLRSGIIDPLKTGHKVPCGRGLLNASPRLLELLSDDFINSLTLPVSSGPPVTMPKKPQKACRVGRLLQWLVRRRMWLETSTIPLTPGKKVKQSLTTVPRCMLC